MNFVFSRFVASPSLFLGFSTTVIEFILQLFTFYGQRKTTLYLLMSPEFKIMGRVSSKEGDACQQRLSPF